MVEDAVAQLTLGALGASGAHLVHYAAALRRACEVHPPPYGQAWFGRQFRHPCSDASRFAHLLASDAHMEGYSAGRLVEFAGWVDDRALATAIRAHARDESRHSRVFGHLLAYATEATRPKVESAIVTIIRDEVEHIRYTAEYIERALAEDSRVVGAIMSEFQWALNKVTMDDFASGPGESAPYGDARCTS
jgi:tRNA isopentenyl-2-thiomethyl-A-37 hydroxylase MiaE